MIDADVFITAKSVLYQQCIMKNVLFLQHFGYNQIVVGLLHQQ